MTEADIEILNRLMRLRPRRDGGPFKVMSQLYPYNALSVDDINYKPAYWIVSRLEREGYLEPENSRRAKVRYRLTTEGRFRVLSCMMGLKFLSMCIVVEAYSDHVRQRKNRTDRTYYTRHMEQSLGDTYAFKTIGNTATALCRHGYAERISNHKIRLSNRTFSNMGKHDKVIKEIHMWMEGVPVTLNEARVKRMEAEWKQK